jgi:Lipocalin-like domain
LLLCSGPGRFDCSGHIVCRGKERTDQEGKDRRHRELVNTAGGFAAGSTFEFTKDGKLKINFKGKDERRDESAYTVEGDTISFSSSDGVKRDTKKIKKLTNTELVIEIFEFKRK